MKIWHGYQKGINLGGWFSQCNHNREHYEQFITKKDFAEFAKWDIDHVRIPIDYNLVEDADGNYLSDGFAYLWQALEWCRKYHLNMVLDLHKTVGYSFDSQEQETGFFVNETYQERFYRLWEELTRRFGKYESMLAFELLNEVVDKEVCSQWNQIADTCIARIRKIAPTIKIVVGGYWNNSVMAIKDLGMPQDENIVYNFHCYAPLLFTHQGASWVEGMPRDFRYDFKHTIEEFRQKTAEIIPYELGAFQGLEGWEEQMGAGYFKEIMKEAVEVAQQRNVPLYCGEYGVINNVSPENALLWYQAIHEAFEEYGIGRAAWSYKGMNYGLQDEHMKSVIGRLQKYL